MQKWIHGVTVGMSLVLWAACAGCGGGGSGNGVMTSVPHDEPISDLPPAERTQFCADVATWAMMGPFLTGSCNVVAWTLAYADSLADTAATDATLQSTCEAAYSQCLANGVTNTCDAAKLATCTATVSEFNACLSDTLAALVEWPACSAVTRGSLASNVAGGSEGRSSAACTTVKSLCPGA